LVKKLILFIFYHHNIFDEASLKANYERRLPADFFFLLRAMRSNRLCAASSARPTRLGTLAGGFGNGFPGFYQLKRSDNGIIQQT